MTSLLEDTETGADIQAAVSAALAPFLRRKGILPLDPIKVGKENGCDLVVDADRMLENFDTCLIPNDHSVTDTEVDHQPTAKPYFRLWLTDERAFSRSPIENDCHIRSDAITHVLLDWSDRILDFYDVSFLEDLPEIFKSEFTVKKTRQEAISLFSCLEAFLKEEPLGPDDMWLVACLQNSNLIFRIQFILLLLNYSSYSCLVNVGTVLPVRNTDKQLRNLTCGGCLTF